MTTIDLARPPHSCPRSDVACAGAPQPPHRGAGLPAQAPSAAAATEVEVSTPARAGAGTARAASLPPGTVLVLATAGSPGITVRLREAAHALGSLAQPARTGLVGTSTAAPGALCCARRAHTGRDGTDTGPEPLAGCRPRGRDPRVGPAGDLGPSCPRRRACWSSATASTDPAQELRRGRVLAGRAARTFLAVAVLDGARALRGGQR